MTQIITSHRRVRQYKVPQIFSLKGEKKKNRIEFDLFIVKENGPLLPYHSTNRAAFYWIRRKIKPLQSSPLEIQGEEIGFFIHSSFEKWLKTVLRNSRNPYSMPESAEVKPMVKMLLSDWSFSHSLPRQTPSYRFQLQIYCH